MTSLATFSLGASWWFFVLAFGMIAGSRPIARRAARDGRSSYGLGVVGLTRLYIFNGLLALAAALLIGLRVI
jgi:hypothetical protein